MNSFGRIFRISIYGESHGKEIGVLIDACPAGILLSESDFFESIAKRSAGQFGTTSRVEDDCPKIISGVYNSYTTGAPILISFENFQQRSDDYEFNGFFRPGHADFTAYKKYNGYNNPLGGGHFSGRLTLALVTAGVIAKKILRSVEFDSKIVSVGGSQDIYASVENAMKEKDSLGGIVECRAKNVPIGLGEPFFDSVESLISHLMFSVPGVKAIEFGNGFACSQMKGSEFNDLYCSELGETQTNNSGGINGGITNGNELLVKVHFKPTSSIGKAQKTFNFKSNSMEELVISGRHDSCFALRTPIIVESVLAVVLADLLIISKKYE